MSVELTMLIYTVLVFVALLVFAATVRILEVGLIPAAGSRDRLPEPGTFSARCERNVRNHIEGLVMFSPLILIVELTGANGDVTALAAQIYAGSRAAHAILYLTGIPWVRTLVWTVGVVAWAMIAITLLF